MSTPPISWAKAQRYLRDEVRRVVRLLRSVRHPAAPALGDWSVAQVAMHLSQAWLAVPGLARRDLSPVAAAVPELALAGGGSLIRDMWELGQVTRLGVDSDPERDPLALADRIEARAAAYFSIGGGAGDRRAWLVEGAEVSLATLTCHLLNETVVHGWDIARGDGQRWKIPRAHAAMIIDGFLVPVMAALPPRALVDQQVATGLLATYEIRLKGGGRHVLHFDNGALSVERPGGRRVGCVIDADPVAFLLVVWGREHQARAIVERKLVASGPEAWLGPRLRGLMRIP